MSPIYEMWQGNVMWNDSLLWRRIAYFRSIF